MANKPMKRGTTSLGIKWMQIKNTVRYHYTPIRVKKEKGKWIITNAEKNME